MISYLLAGPAGEPVSLVEAKAFLRLDSDAEDGLLATLIAAARLHIESVSGRALLRQTWRLVLDRWPAERVVSLPVTPLISIEAVTAFDEQGDDHAVPVGQFLTEPERLLLPRAVEGMPDLRERLGLEIDYVAGFGEAADVPPDLKQALLVLVGHWFENRDAVLVAGAGAVIPFGFDRLVASYRKVRL